MVKSACRKNLSISQCFHWYFSLSLKLDVVRWFETLLPSLLKGTLMPPLQLPVTPQARRARIEALAKFGIAAAVIIGVAPFVFLLVKGVVGLAISAAVGFTAIQFAPVFAMKIANWKLKAIKVEASQNPIETLENLLIERKAALTAAKQNLAQIMAQIDSFIEKAEGFVRKQPQTAEKWQERIQKARTMRASKARALEQAGQAVQQFEKEVDVARVEWDLVLAEQAMNKSLNIMSGDPMDLLKERTAIDSVRGQMNAAFASLDVELLLEDQSQDGIFVPLSTQKPELLERVS